MKCVSCGKYTKDKVDNVPCCEKCYTGDEFYDWCKIHRPDLIVTNEKDTMTQKEIDEKH